MASKIPTSQVLPTKVGVEEVEMDVPEERVEVEANEGSSESLEDVETSESESSAVQEERLRMAKVTLWISALKPTRAEMLRAVPAYRVLERCGWHLMFQKTKTQKEKLFTYSRPVDFIHQFWSHSWHGKHYWKAWSLLFYQNALPAFCLGTTAAALMALLFFLELLPGWIKTSNYAPPEPHAYGSWALHTGALTYLLTILLWRSRSEVFVDLFCIHQADPKLKSEGILNLGAILKMSRSLVVVWDETYLKRLWCVFELAAFLKSHQTDLNSELVIKPNVLGPAAFWNFVVVMITMSSDLFWAGFSSFIRFVLVFFAAFPIMWTVLAWRRSLMTVQAQISEFSVRNTMCYCCSQNHVDAKGNRIVCDREVIDATICKWFGSLEEFDSVVRNDVEAEVRKQLSVSPFGYWWVLNAVAPILWGQGFDKAAAILRHGETDWGLAILLSGFSWHMLVAPFNFGMLELLSRQFERRFGVTWGFCSTALLLTCQCFIYLCCHFCYYTCFEYLKPPLLAVVVFSAVACLMFLLVYPCESCKKRV